MGDIFDTAPDTPAPGLTIAKLKSVLAILKRGCKPMPGSTENRTVYMSRATWIDFGGDPAVWDALPSVAFGDTNE